MYVCERNVHRLKQNLNIYICRQNLEEVLFHVFQSSNFLFQEPSLAGIFQWSGAEEMTKYEMCVVMADVFNLPKDHIKPDSTPTSGAVRPYNAHLHSGRLEDLGIGKRRSYKDGITEVLRPFVN